MALALALIVHEDVDNFTPRSRDLVKFHTIGIVLLTLLINGTTTGWVMKKFNVIENLEQREDFKEQYKKRLENEANDVYNKAK